MTTRISILEIADRLEIGRLAVYALLKEGKLPGIRQGRRWIVTRFAYERWERNCGFKTLSRSGQNQDPQAIET